MNGFHQMTHPRLSLAVWFIISDRLTRKVGAS
jgi:hypothetical protein